MIDWTNTHFRVLLRLIAPQALLYTEMQTCGAIENNPHRALGYSPMESPLALQLGGANKNALVAAARLAEDKGFKEINLNLGCPSDRVQAGRFGACLMAEPDIVAECIASLKAAVAITVSAKTRIGIDKADSYDFFANFAHVLQQAACDKIIVHARKAWLHGLNPKQNRTIPPVQYDYVYRIKNELPFVPIVINGNIATLVDVQKHMNYVDGIMIGRLACQDPYSLSVMHRYFYPEMEVLSATEVIHQYLQYVRVQFQQGVPLSILLKPIFNFSCKRPFAKIWKQQLMSAQQNKSTALLDSAEQLYYALEN